MPILDHLKELRKRILWALGFLVFTFAVCWVFSNDLYQIARAAIDATAAATLGIFRPQDIFSLHLRVAMVTAIFLASPFILTQA